MPAKGGRKKKVGGRKMRGGKRVSTMPVPVPFYPESNIRGSGFFDSIGDAFRSIPAAFTQIIPGIKGAVDNKQEIINRGQQMVDYGKKAYEIGKQVAPFVGGRRRKRKPVNILGRGKQIMFTSA